jgi:metal-sulfur cluster biosynthetic enzyme
VEDKVVVTLVTVFDPEIMVVTLVVGLISQMLLLGSKTHWLLNKLQQVIPGQSSSVWH